MPLHIETPLIESPFLSHAGHCAAWLKLEALQPPGSFKIRGVGAACEEYLRRGARRFVSSSGGNAGLAVAYAGRRLSVPVTVVVPETASARARKLLQLEAAQVIVHGASWHEANLLAGAVMFDRPRVAETRLRQHVRNHGFSRRLGARVSVGRAQRRVFVDDAVAKAPAVDFR